MKNKIQFINRVILSIGTNTVQIKKVQTFDVVEQLLKLLKENDMLDTFMDEETIKQEITSQVISSKDDENIEKPDAVVITTGRNSD